MKKIKTFIIIMFISLTALYSADTLRMHTSFSFSLSAITGFSKKPVASASSVPELDRCSSADIIDCKFDPNTNTYISPVFYSYVQGFSLNPLKVTLSAPSTMTSEAGDKKIPYTLSSLEGAAAWGQRQDADLNDTVNYVEYIEQGLPGGYSSRVVFNQPIQVVVDSKDVGYGEKYSVEFRLKVEPKV